MIALLTFIAIGLIVAAIISWIFISRNRRRNIIAYGVHPSDPRFKELLKYRQKDGLIDT